MSERRHFYAQPQAEEISRNAVHGERSELDGRQLRVEGISRNAVHGERSELDGNSPMQRKVNYGTKKAPTP